MTARSGRGAGLVADRPVGAPRPPMHPADDRARYRRRRLLALVVLVIASVAGVIFGGRAMLLHVAKFRVASIEVEAPPEVNPDVVRVATGIHPGRALLAVDLEEVQRAVGMVPQVASVVASRHWPDTVRLEVTGRTPVALTDSASGPWFVDSIGTVYQAAPKSPPPLPRLVADRVAPGDAATTAGLAVLASLAPEVRQKLQVVEADGPSDVTLRLVGGKQVKWGSPGDSARKAAVLVVLLSQHGALYDVSAPDLPTIRR